MVGISEIEMGERGELATQPPHGDGVSLQKGLSLIVPVRKLQKDVAVGRVSEPRQAIEGRVV